MNRLGNRFGFISRALRLMSIVVGLGLLAGCLPIPHTTERSHAVHGRVLDATTHAPIQGAKIFLIQSPHHATYTDAAGFFHMKATRNFHWAYVFGEDWPQNKYFNMEALHVKYLPHDFEPDITGREDVGDLLLKPEQPSSR
jgi:hypothetical protein